MINPRMVRGLDYYTKTTFEVTTDFSEHRMPLSVGTLRWPVKELGGPDIPGIGLRSAANACWHDPVKSESFSAKPDLFIAALGDESQQLAFRLCNHFRMSGILTEMDYLGKSLKSQMKRADKFQCAYTLILGEKELRERKAELRKYAPGNTGNHRPGRD